MLLGRKAMTNLDSILKSRDLAYKGLSSQRYSFSSSNVWMWELEYKESWVPKNWCWTVVLERLFRVPWTARRSNQSIPKEIGPEYSLEGVMLKLKLQYSGHLMWRTVSLEKTPWCWERLKAEEKGMTEDEIVWHHLLDGHKFEQAPGAGDGQGSLVCCSSWGRKASDTTEQLNWLTDWLTYIQWNTTDIKRNKIGSFVEMWMDPETFTQSKVSQKNKYHILMHTCAI